MISNAYSLYDRKALAYSPPFFMAADGLALRALSDLVSDTNTSVGRHPDDYVLYCVGGWDDANGTLLPMSPLRHVIDAVALVAPVGGSRAGVTQGHSAPNGEAK